MCPGLIVLTPTERPYLNQCFDVPSSKHLIHNHLEKTSHTQVLKKKCPLVPVIPGGYVIYQQDRETTLAVILLVWSHQAAKPRWCWDSNSV